jgi:two-component system OmpR family sensor kinase
MLLSLWSVARFDDTTAAPAPEPVDVSELAQQAVSRFEAVAEARRLTLVVHPAASAAIVAVPPEWLDRLLSVLIDNACKYSPDGGQVEVSVAAEGQRVRLTVDDAGPGIPESDRNRIFDRFHRATSGAEGAGLGLAIADVVVRATGGRWQVGSAPLGGARMSISWPAWSAGNREPSHVRELPPSTAHD